jgi:hypothetical protein
MLPLAWELVSAFQLFEAPRPPFIDENTDCEPAELIEIDQKYPKSVYMEGTIAVNRKFVPHEVGVG